MLWVDGRLERFDFTPLTGLRHLRNLHVEAADEVELELDPRAVAAPGVLDRLDT